MKQLPTTTDNDTQMQGEEITKLRDVFWEKWVEKGENPLIDISK